MTFYGDNFDDILPVSAGPQRFPMNLVTVFSSNSSICCRTDCQASENDAFSIWKTTIKYMKHG